MDQHTARRAQQYMESKGTHLGVGSSDDDLSSGMGNSDLASRVSFVGQLPHEELGELGVEHTIGDGLSSLADVLVGGHC